MSRVLVHMVVAAIAVASIGPSARAADPWKEKAIVYLNFESKDTINGQLFLGIDFLPNRMNPNPYNPAHFDPYGVAVPDPINDPDDRVPQWLVPPDHVEPPYDDNRYDPNDVEESEGYPKFSQPAFSSVVFNPALKRRDCVNGISTDVAARLGFLYIEITTLFDPVTFRPAAVALQRKDFKFEPNGRMDANNNPLWSLIPQLGSDALGNADPSRKKVWLANIGGPHPSLHGLALVVGNQPREMGRVLRSRGAIYVWSNEQASGCAGACTLVNCRNGVTHTTVHEIGHILGVNANTPAGVFHRDFHGHWLCNMPPPPLLPAVNSPNVLSQGQCVGVNQKRNNAYPIELVDRITMIANVGPSCQLCRSISRVVNLLTKPPPGRNKNRDLLVLVSHLCWLPVDERLTFTLRSAAINQLLAQIDIPGDLQPSQVPAFFGQGGAWEQILTNLADDRYVAICHRVPGDLTNDGRIDQTDQEIQDLAYGSTISDPNYDPNADLDCDGDVDALDRAILQGHGIEGEICDEAPLVTSPLITEGSTLGSFIQLAPACGDAVSEWSGVWYAVVGTGTTMTARTCSPYTSFDTRLSVFCGTCETFGCVVGNDDDAGCTEPGAIVPGSRSSISWCSDFGRTYYLLVHSAAFNSGRFELTLTDDGVPCAAADFCGCAVDGCDNDWKDADFDNDCDVDLGDLAILLNNYGTIGGNTNATGDADGDGNVMLSDLSIVLSRFGAVCR